MGQSQQVEPKFSRRYGVIADSEDLVDTLEEKRRAHKAMRQEAERRSQQLRVPEQDHHSAYRHSQRL